jgi:hypothetical protein
VLSAPTAARKFFAGVIADYNINDTSGRQLVLEAARCIDRIAEARAIIRKAGPIVIDRFGCPKMHPAVLIERDSRQQLAMCLRSRPQHEKCDDPCYAASNCRCETGPPSRSHPDRLLRVPVECGKRGFCRLRPPSPT